MNIHQTRIQKLIDYGSQLAQSDRIIKMAHWLYKSDCGTAGCLIGWALHDGIFEDKGFYLHPENGYPLLQQDNHTWLTETSAIAIFLDMPLDDAQMIFIEPPTLERCLDYLRAYFRKLTGDSP